MRGVRVWCALAVGTLLAASQVAWGQASVGRHGHVEYSLGAGARVLSGPSLLLMDKGYKQIDAISKASVRRAGAVSTITWKSPNKLVDLTVTVDESGEDRSATMTFDAAIRPHERGQHVELCLPLPAEYLAHWPRGSQGMRRVPTEGELTLETPVGALKLNAAGSTPNAVWYLDDLRGADWARNFRLRVAPSYSPEKGCSFKAVLRLSQTPPSGQAFVCLDLSKAVNRTLRDDVDGDRKGGWTDQGANDLRILRTGRQMAQGIPFEFIDGAIVLQGRERPYFPAASPEIAFPEGLKAERLCFVHTVGWFEKFRAEAFRYEVTYEDGEVVRVPVLYQVQTCDWWGAREPLEARFAWRGSNAETEVALHHWQWRNPRPEKALKSLRVVSLNCGVVPAVLAVTAVRAGALEPEQYALLDHVFAQREQRDVAKVDITSWFACPIAWQDTIEAGSALDVSGLNHRPAGRYGWMKADAKTGSFVFERRPGEPVRLWGTNAALRGPFPSKEDARGIAACLAKQGVNHVRLHLYAVYPDCLLAEGGGLNPESLDKMEFFIAELKRNGIYIYMDLNDGMMFNRLLDKPMPEKGAKYAAMFNRELVGACKRLATELFTHRNPYTGLRMVDDPAICMYEITNENSITSGWHNLKDSLDPLYFNELEQLWKDWQRAQGIQDIRGIIGHFSSMGDDGRRFAAEMMRRHLEEMHAHLRSIGVKAPICGTNITFTTGDLWAAQNMEYTNDHAYFDHPNVGARPMTYNNNVMVRENATRLGIMPSFSRAKVAGKPLSASEWNFCYPNDTRCEGLPIMTAYSSFQNWDSLLFYCATGSFDAGTWARFHEAPGILVHSQQTDPSTWGLSQACAVAFRQRHIQPSGKVIRLDYEPADIWKNLNVAGRWPFLTAMARLETRLVPSRPADQWPMAYDTAKDSREHFADAVQRLGLANVSATRVTGDTGEIVRYPEVGLFTVDTPKSKMATGALNALADSEHAIRDLDIASPARFATVTLTALDDQPVTSSKRMLLCIVANSRNQDGRFNGFEIQDMGRKGPVLTEPVEAEFALTSDSPVTVYRLNSLTGRREGTVKSVLADGKARFSTTGAKTIYFELVR